jgi:hypothetical protein
MNAFTPHWPAGLVLRATCSAYSWTPFRSIFSPAASCTPTMRQCWNVTGIGAGCVMPRAGMIPRSSSIVVCLGSRFCV